MQKKSGKYTYGKQFKKGTFPDEPIYPRSVSVREPSPPSPSAIKKRQGIAIGSQTEAYPGMVAKNDYSRKRRK